jgi:hypothetical protein
MSTARRTIKNARRLARAARNATYDLHQRYGKNDVLAMLLGRAHRRLVESTKLLEEALEHARRANERRRAA